MEDILHKEIYKQAIVDAQKEVDFYSKELTIRKRALYETESELVFAKENLLKAKDKLIDWENTQDMNSCEDDVRNEEISRFKEVLPKCLNELKNEKQLDYLKVWELNTY